MAQYTEEQITYPLIKGAKFSNYGFMELDGELIFSRYHLKKGDDWSRFIDANFRDIADCYYLAYKNDCELLRTRKRKLSSFLKSVWEQTQDVSLLMIKAIACFKDLSEEELVEKIIREVLPGIGYTKVRKSDGRYYWEIGERKKFDSGIGKVLVLTYINNRFNKDDTWKYIKKNCYLKDGTWRYKSNVAKQRIENILSSYIQNGGILVENVNMEFSTFVPMRIISKDALGKDRFFGKQDGDDKHLYVSGAASTTDVDYDTERVSKNFIKKMKKQAIGLPLKVGSHYASDLDSTVGVIVDKGGTEESFDIEGRLQSFDHNPNVEKIAQKMDDGISFGFSIFGRVTKTFREMDKKLGKEVVVLDDGDLSHVLITDQPCNKSTFAEGIVKSLVDKSTKTEADGKPRTIETEFKHSSSILKSEPELEKTGEFPDQAFPINFATDKVHKDYLHHYVQDGILYLHKSWLVQAFNMAKENKAPALVVNHLLNHLQIIGLQKEVDDFVNLRNSIEDLANVKEKLDAIVEKLASDCTAKTINVDSKEAKLKIIQELIEQVAPKVTDLINSSNEDS